MKRGLGEIERRLFAYVQMRGQTVVRAGELAGPLELSAPQERNLLSRLSKAGWIVRVWRGFYLVPRKLPLGGKWSPDEILALNTLMDARRGRYQICGPNAFNRYGLDDQIPNRVYAYNNRISGERTIGAVTLTLIKVADERLGDTEEMQTSEGRTAVYGSRARTLVDAVYDWARFNSLPRAYDWIRGELAAGRVEAAELVTVALRYGDKGTVRRIGALLERVGVDAKLLQKLERALDPSTGLIPWIPTKRKRGKINRRWGIVLNDRT
ncbi:MAG: type IV toxin-antitoxin system AbiEi family antitoxin domain-containing protein [Thermodesulfobacteriota bacterium]